MTRYLKEIFEQPEAIARSINLYNPDLLETIVDSVNNNDFGRVILTGMGSSFYACIPMSYTLGNKLEVPVFIWDASELLHFAQSQVKEDTLLICVSQSGESAELVRLIENKVNPSYSIGITNGTNNTLSLWSDVKLSTQAGPEEAVSTKTYTTTLAIMHLLAQQLTRSNIEKAKSEIIEISKYVEEFLSKTEDHIKRFHNFFGSIQNLAFIGRGYSMASVNTGALITKESSKVFAEGLSSGSFRHGPIELVRSGFNCVIFTGNDKASHLNISLAREIAEKGGKCLLVTPLDVEDEKNISVLRIPAVSSDVLPILEILPIQLLTIPLAQANGFTPATFDYASKITNRE